MPTQVDPAPRTDSAALTEKSTRRGRLRASNVGGRFGLLIAWAAIVIFFSVMRPDSFATTANLQTIFGSQAVLLVLTLGLLLPLTAGEFDLSVSGVLGVSLVLVGALNVTEGWPIVPVIIVALTAGVIIGAINAFLIVVVGVESIIVTLGTGTALTGLGVALSETTVGGISSSLVDAVRTDVFGLPLAFYYGLALTAIIWYVFSYTPLGRYIYFVGVGRDMARLSGVRVKAIRAGSLIGGSFLAALAGVILAGTLGAADPNVGSSYLLPAFAAAFLGSTAIQPGRFNPWGTFVAVYFLVTGITGLQLMGLSGWIEDVFYGGSLVIAVALSRLLGRKTRAAA